MNKQKRISRRTAKVLIAYLLGNCVQIILHTLAANNYMMRPILFCIAAGFLVFLAVVSGVTLANSENPRRMKTYAEYAEEEEVN